MRGAAAGGAGPPSAPAGQHPLPGPFKGTIPAAAPGAKRHSCARSASVEQVQQMQRTGVQHPTSTWAPSNRSCRDSGSPVSKAPGPLPPPLPVPAAAAAASAPPPRAALPLRAAIGVVGGWACAAREEAASEAPPLPPSLPAGERAIRKTTDTSRGSCCASLISARVGGEGWGSAAATAPCSTACM